MHRCLTALLFCLGIGLQPAHSQTYRPFINQSQWFVNEDGALVSAFDWWNLGRDSLIQGEVFYRVVRDEMGLPMYVREDADSQKVWVAAAWNGWQVRTLYDWRLQVGDTIPLEFRGAGQQRFRVELADMVPTTQGLTPRLRLRNLDGNQPDELNWMQGIGDFDHPFYLDYTGLPDPLQHTICSWQNRVKFYDDGFGNCPAGSPILARDDLEPEAGHLQTWPSPAQDHLWVDLSPAPGRWKLSLLTLTGVTTARWEAPGGQSVRLELPSLPTGLYLLRATSPQGQEARTRITLF